MTVILSGIASGQAKKEIRVINEATKRIVESPEKARAYLIEKGFVTKNLKLTKKYSRK